LHKLSVKLKFKIRSCVILGIFTIPLPLLTKRDVELMKLIQIKINSLVSDNNRTCTVTLPLRYTMV